MTNEEAFFFLARSSGDLSRCTRRKVGAVVVYRTAEQTLVETGYNAIPEGLCDEGACPRGLLSYEQAPKDVGYTNPDHPCHALHAEELAVLRMAARLGDPELLRRCTLYVTDKPCPNCARYLAGVGITDIKWKEPP